MCIWSTHPSFSILSLSPRTHVSPLVPFWKIASCCILPPLVIYRVVLLLLFLKRAGCHVCPAYCKNGHHVPYLGLGPCDSAGENCY